MESTVRPAVFESEFGPVRVIEVNGEPYFVASDVASILGYSATSAALRILDDEDKGMHILHTPGGPQQFRTINEGALYELVVRSNRPAARQFRRWVAHEVLPQIRKTGSYSATPAVPSSFAEALELAAAQAREIEALEAQAAVDAPKVEAFDTFMSANGSMSMNEAAKTLGVGQNELFKLLREAGVLIPSGPNRNLPYQRYAHHFEVVQSTYEHPRDGLRPTRTTRVRPSGVEFIARKLGLTCSPPALAG